MRRSIFGAVKDTKGEALFLLRRGLQPAKGAHERRQSGRELRAFAAGRLWPARPFQGRFQPETSPPPSGRACDGEEQPSARGRLRAAAVSLKPQIQNEKGRIKNESLHPMLIRFRAAACGERNDAEELRASAAPGCGPLRPRGRKFKIQDSKFRITNSGHSLRGTPATSRSCGPPRRGGCGPPIAARSIRGEKARSRAAERTGGRCRQGAAASESHLPESSRAQHPYFFPTFAAG